MTTYKLNFGFYIEMDALNYTLCRKCIGKSRDGQEKEAVKTCGYFGNLESALKEYLRLVQIENLKDETFSADEFLQAIKKSNEAAVEEIIKRIDGSEKKQSNGDRIRGMGDEELAKFLVDFNECEVCGQFDKNSGKCNELSKFICTKGYKELVAYEWLKQPVED